MSGATPISPTAIDALLADGQAAGAITPAFVRNIVDSLSGGFHTSQTTSYTAALTDRGTLIEFNSATNVNFTIPPHSVVPFTVDTIINIVTLGIGAVVLVAGTGVVFDTSTGVLASAGQYTQFSIRQRAINEWIPEGTFQNFTTAATYFVVATNGSDANSGTFIAPFATASKAKLAMRATSGGTTTTYFRAGVYTVATPSAPYLDLLNADSGTTWAGWPGDPYQSAILQYATTPTWVLINISTPPTTNITITNLTLDGGVSGGTGPGNGIINGTGPGLSGITLTHLHFQNNFFGPGITFWDMNNFTFMFNECGPNEYQPISIHNTDVVSYGNYTISGNFFHNYLRMGMEIQVDTSLTSYWYNVHIDWNIFEHYFGSTDGSMYGISFVSGDQTGVGLGGNTIWGNQFIGTQGQNAIGIESGNPNTTIANNTFTNLDYPFSISGPINCPIFNNTMTGYNTALDGAPYHQDGGYNGSEWIGTNTLNGSPVAGWPGTSNVYGTEPTTYAPSTQVAPIKGP